MERNRYIKPSVIELDYSTDEEIVSLGTCKSNNNSNQQTVPIILQGTSCSSSQCSSVSPS